MRDLDLGFVAKVTFDLFYVFSLFSLFPERATFVFLNNVFILKFCAICQILCIISRRPGTLQGYFTRRLGSWQMKHQTSI